MRSKMKFLLLYVREDAVFARLTGETPCDAEIRETVSESAVEELLARLISLVIEMKSVAPKSLTVVYALSRMTEILSERVSVFLNGLEFADSVSVLRRDEIFCGAAATRSVESPCQVLFCDTRETRLFTEKGEFALPWSLPNGSGRTGGNGFYDWIFGFVGSERESSEYLLRQIDRFKRLTRAYRCFKPAEETDDTIEERLFPSDIKSLKLVFPEESIEQKNPKRKKATEEANSSAAGMHSPVYTEETPIRYYALSDVGRQAVDEKLPAFCRDVRDKRGNYKKITLAEAARAFDRLFGAIRQAPLTELYVAGYYAHFPMTQDFLASLPSRPVIHFEKASKLLLDGMEWEASKRLRCSQVSLCDMDGDVLFLWKQGDEEEKRVVFAATVPYAISQEDFAKPILPYTLETERVRKLSDDIYVPERIIETGDLKDFCYLLQKDGFYRLTEDSSEKESDFRTVLLGISATLDGICCHFFSSGAPAIGMTRLVGDSDE